MSTRNPSSRRRSRSPSPVDSKKFLGPIMTADQKRKADAETVRLLLNVGLDPKDFNLGNRRASKSPSPSSPRRTVSRSRSPLILSEGSINFARNASPKTNFYVPSSFVPDFYTNKRALESPRGAYTRRLSNSPRLFKSPSPSKVSRSMSPRSRAGTPSDATTVTDRSTPPQKNPKTVKKSNTKGRKIDGYRRGENRPWESARLAPWYKHKKRNARAFVCAPHDRNGPCRHCGKPTLKRMCLKKREFLQKWARSTENMSNGNITKRVRRRQQGRSSNSESSS